MARIEVIPELIIDDTWYELVVAGIAQYAPEIGSLSREYVTDPDHWLNIPDVWGRVSKAELKLPWGPVGEAIVNVWQRPDIRGREESIPHNHSWGVFHSHILRGAYEEIRVRRTNIDPETDHADLAFEPYLTHASPATNVVPQEVYHEIPVVEAGTTTLMLCGPRTPEKWSHLDLTTGKRRRDQPVEGFDAMLAALNPHRRGQQ